MKIKIPCTGNNDENNIVRSVLAARCSGCVQCSPVYNTGLPLPVVVVARRLWQVDGRGYWHRHGSAMQRLSTRRTARHMALLATCFYLYHLHYQHSSTASCVQAVPWWCWSPIDSQWRQNLWQIASIYMLLASKISIAVHIGAKTEVSLYCCP